jgi:c-di-GMP-binding flagellar brake protein YcgR
MSQPMEIHSERQVQLLEEAASRRWPAVIACRTDNGWVNVKSRFLACDPASERLTLEYPFSANEVIPELVAGQDVGVSFRRGHKKCAFNALVTGSGQMELGAGTVRAPIVTLSWPEDMHELQRRLYYRSPAPSGSAIPVKLWRGDKEGPCAGPSWSCRGRLVDLSAGGISIWVSRCPIPQWEEDEAVGCSFPVDSGGAPVSITGRLRHWEVTAQGTRVGVHFVGLDTSLADRDTLRQVIRLTTRFQQINARCQGGRH